MLKNYPDFDLSHKLLPVLWPDVNDETWEGYDEISVETSISFHSEDPSKSHKAAISNGFILYPVRAYDQCRISTHTLFDSIDAEVWGFYSDCELRKVFENLLPDRVVIISQVGVNPKYRGLDIGISVVKSWIANLEAGETLFLLHPGAMNRTDGKYPSWFNLGNVPTHKRRVDNPGDVLARYWQKAGFRDWPGTTPMLHATGVAHMFYSTGVLAGVIQALYSR